MAPSKTINRTGYSSPYLTEAMVHNGTVYCSGKIGMSAETGELVSDDAGEQTVRAHRKNAQHLGPQC